MIFEVMCAKAGWWVAGAVVAVVGGYFGWEAMQQDEPEPEPEPAPDPPPRRKKGRPTVADMSPLSRAEVMKREQAFLGDTVDRSRTGNQ